MSGARMAKKFDAERYIAQNGGEERALEGGESRVG
jgi:hypothetical protein